MPANSKRSFSTLDTTAYIVAAYVKKNKIPAARIADLIASVSKLITRLSTPTVSEPTRPVPPVNPKKTISDDFIISLEDGKPYRTLTRHLSTKGLTPDEYRRKWGLPSNYPMVAPSYSASRSALASKFGLGQRRGSA